MSSRGQQIPGALSFGDVFDARRNAFAFLRFALAILVIISHCYVLGGFGSDPLERIAGPRLTLGLLAVAMFFVLSGFLITRSAVSSLSTSRFLWHRFLRIFPGYWVCLVICAFFIAPVVFGLEHGRALRIFSIPDNSPQAFVVGNFAMFHFNGWSISGVMNIEPWSIGLIMGHNPVRWIVNGSLWSLPYEWMCYLVVALLATLRVFRNKRSVVMIAFVAFWSLYAFDWLAPQLFHDCFPYRGLGVLVMLCAYFSAGSVFFLYRSEIRFSLLLAVAASVLLAGGLFIGCIGVIAPIALTYIFLWLACRVPIHRFDARGDYSYGLYIYAFPTQQALAFLQVHTVGFAVYLASTICLTFVFAVLSYHFVEAPCLRLKHMAVPSLFRRSRRKKSDTAIAPAAAVTHP